MDETAASPLALSMIGVRRRNPFDARRSLAQQMLTKGMSEEPIVHPLQGAARLAQSLVGGWSLNKADEDEKAALEKRGSMLAERMAAAGAPPALIELAKADADVGMRYVGQWAVEQAKQREQAERLRGASLGPGYGMPPPQGGPPGQSDNAERIAGIESNGAPNGGYGAVGPPADAKGSRAYGRYQVMDFNIGPWTQEVLGRQMTPQEFLANPEAQNKVFEAKFGQYVSQYGSPQAASRAWFAGPGGMNNPNARDVLGTTVAGYERKFNGGAPGTAAVPAERLPMPPPPPPAPATEAYPEPPQQVAQVSGMPPAPSPQGVSGPVLSAPPIPDMRRPQPTPEMIAKHEQLLKSGAYGMNPAEAMARARAAIDTELTQLHSDNTTRAKMDYDQRLGDYKYGREQGDKRPDKVFEQEGKLRDDFTKEAPVKNYRTVVPMLESAKDAATRPTRAADLNLVYAFAKLMDPESVVRESETGAVVATQSVMDRIGAYVGQLNGQPMLNPETRQKLLAELNSRFIPLKQSHDAILEQYANAARSYGLDPQRTFFGVRQPSQGAAPASGGGGDRPGPTRIDINGKPL